ncbi:uncharacterized protein LOC130013022 [Patella vulgata]|uniref:uncharacterized protein LOC130013022 n=1 Tax=Patella vulgata TaxID=6465 RepID=UPI0024A94B81|nr:uncharacterized protein LOC130013022 [Patella vulgata]
MRMQIPLRPAAAKTVHRSQGDTLESVVIDFEGRKTRHIHFVGLSRVKTIEGLHIINLNENKISVSNDVKVEMNELRTTRKVICRTRDLSSVSSDKIIVVYHNVRSLQTYFEDVKASLCKINATVVILAETRVIASVNSDMYNIPGYTLYRNDAVTEILKNHHGMAVYVNDKMKLKNIVVEPFNMNGVEMNVITLDIEIENIKNFCKILGLCKPPKVSEGQFCSALIDVSKTSNETDFTIVLGDFNMKFEKCKTSSVNEVLKGMSQLIDEPTTDSDTVIDLIYSDLPKDHIRSGIQENYFSDHKVIYLMISKEKLSNDEDKAYSNINAANTVGNENMWKFHTVKENKKAFLFGENIPAGRISKEMKKN